MKTYWVCVAHRWAIPAVECGARGEGDSGANKHSQKHPFHPTFTTTNLASADALAGSERTAA